MKIIGLAGKCCYTSFTM